MLTSDHIYFHSKLEYLSVFTQKFKTQTSMEYTVVYNVPRKNFDYSTPQTKTDWTIITI